MKKLLLISLLSILIASCDNPKREVYPQYRIGTINVIPDSLKDDQAKFIVETMRAASSNLTTSDYEDVDDAIEEAHDCSEKIYGINVRCLEVIESQSGYWDAIPTDRMTKKRKRNI